METRIIYSDEMLFVEKLMPNFGEECYAFNARQRNLFVQFTLTADEFKKLVKGSDISTNDEWHRYPINRPTKNGMYDVTIQKNGSRYVEELEYHVYTAKWLQLGYIVPDEYVLAYKEKSKPYSPEDDMVEINANNSI